MPLSSARTIMVGQTPHSHEKEAIDFALSVLPDVDPYHAWGLVELLEPSTGRLYEIDLLVLGYSALYLIEIKSRPGRYEGDLQEWWVTSPGDKRPRYMDGPLSLANLKAKVLKSRLQHAARLGDRCPYIQPLIFLSAEDIDLRFKPEGRTAVVTRKELLPAIQHHRFPGANPSWRGERIARPVMADVVRGLNALGLRPSAGRALAGSYELLEIVGEGPGYQDRAAVHRDRGFPARARVYLVPQQASVERRQQLRRAADRESTLLWDVREHPNVLRFTDYVSDAPLGPTVLFDDLAGGVPLDAFLRREPDLPFDDRLTIVEQVGRALAFCHRKSVVHGAVSPGSVLVRRNPETQAIETRLFNFQLGTGKKVEGTSHWSALAQEAWALYQAPELRENPLARKPVADIFSLGALAYFTLTGRAPGERVEDVDRRLEKERCLDPRAAMDGIRQGVADAIVLATDVSPVSRADNVDEWLDYLLSEATAPEPVAAPDELDPLEAKKGDELAGGLEVGAVLGVGATARVLLVRRKRDERSFALKVASDPGHDARLLDEADVLQKLPKHPRIVEVIDTPVIKGRQCLLLSLAGERTLQQKLTQLGPVSLDEASRYGDDLLIALEHLEEHQVLHRDIKPANLGVGSVNKGVDHLTLFDFSLARISPSETQVGTAVYRDPYLRSEGRGAWDFAADRWSAAITLHEMLAGTRPTFGGRSALDPEARIEIAVERFDPSVRDELARFFQKALARSPSERFASAQEMRHAWIAIVGAPARSKAKSTATASVPEPEVVEIPNHVIAQIAGDTPVAALPLSVRARNALDRAGAVRAQDLLLLPSNRLSAVRGVGRLVAQEILTFRDRWKALRSITAPEQPPFFPGYAGEDLLLATVGLSTPLVEALVDAGLPGLRAVAAAPASNVQRLVDRAGVQADALRKVLAAENERANQRERPTTLEGWIESLLPSKKGKKERRLVRALYGLEPPFVGRLDVTVRELATAEGKTQPAVYAALGKARLDWAAHRALPELRAMLTERVEAAAGAASLKQLAEELALSLPHAPDVDPGLCRAQAAALFRVLVEVDKDSSAGLRLVRLRDQEPWIALSHEHARVARALGEVADALAARASLASTGEARRALEEALEGSPLAGMKEERLFELAARASASAARSARLEIYPRGLEPARAVALCAATFKGAVSEADVRARVEARYPEAAPLPARPELDALLAPLGFTWDPESERYRRAGEPQTSTLRTETASLTRLPTAHPTQARAMDPEAIDGRMFDETLKHALEMNAFRVLGVTANRAQAAALMLAKQLHADLVAFDQELAREVEVQRIQGGIPSDDVVFAADRAGPKGEHWPRLLRLVNAAAESLAARLFPPKRPLVLAQPGPIARYGLTDFLAKLTAFGADREHPAIFLLVPSHDVGGVPRIGGTLSIPGLLPGQAMWVSRAWLSNRHNAAA